MTIVNGHEVAARERKAVALADVLDVFEVPADVARDLPHSARMDAAAVAGVKLPSQDTWDRVCELLADRDATRHALRAAVLKGRS